MKRLIILSLSLLALTSCSDLKKRMDELEDRVLALEKQCEMMNSNIEALRSIVNVLNQADFITGVTPIEVGGKIIGYTLEFRNSPSITIYNGSDGKDAPVIGIRKDGGTYYWTIGDDWLLDDDGNRIAAKGGITPRMKIEDGYWWISYDNGVSWEKLSQEMPMMVKDIREDADYVYITLASGTQIRLPKVSNMIRFEDATVRMICIKHWDTNKDGELSYEEAAEVTSLGTYFQFMDILYFNELQYFTGLEKIEDEAFYKSMLQEVTLPGSLKAIGTRAFYGTPIAGIVIPECVETIGEGAFYACRKLTYAN